MAVLDGKAVIITGAGRGLGRAYALHAAEHGAAVVVNDVDAGVAREVVSAIEAAGGVASAAVGSVADWDFCESLVAGCVSAYGKIDGLVNNAGLFYVSEPWADDEARIRRLIEVNVLGTMFCGAHALRQMVRQRSGSIVNVTSGAHSGLPGMATYGGSKGAVASYTYNAAGDAMPHNVRVNAISPLAMTRMGLARDGAVSDAIEYDPGSGPAAPGLASLPPENVAPLVTYLLSDLSDRITGQVVRLQGTRLSLIEHPVSVEPTAEREGWTPELVAEAFRDQLSAVLRPVGMARTTYEWSPAADR